MLFQKASFFVWLTEALYLIKFQKAVICIHDFQGARDTTLTQEKKIVADAKQTIGKAHHVMENSPKKWADL